MIGDNSDIKLPSSCGLMNGFKQWLNFLVIQRLLMQRSGLGGIFNILESSRFGRVKMTSDKLSTLLKVRERGNEADKKVAFDRTFGES